MSEQMTPQEAIFILQSLRDYGDSGGRSMREEETAYTMAISALQSDITRQPNPPRGGES